MTNSGNFYLVSTMSDHRIIQEVFKTKGEHEMGPSITSAFDEAHRKQSMRWVRHGSSCPVPGCDGIMLVVRNPQNQQQVNLVCSLDQRHWIEGIVKPTKSLGVSKGWLYASLRNAVPGHNCPVCGGKLRWKYNPDAEEYIVFCEHNPQTHYALAYVVANTRGKRCPAFYPPTKKSTYLPA